MTGQVFLGENLDKCPRGYRSCAGLKEMARELNSIYILPGEATLLRSVLFLNITSTESLHRYTRSNLNYPLHVQFSHVWNDAVDRDSAGSMPNPSLPE